MESRHSKSIDLKSRSKFKFKYPNATLLNSFIHLRINWGPICDANCYLMCTLGSHSSPVSTSFTGFYLGSWNEYDFCFGQYSIVWIVWVWLVSGHRTRSDTDMCLVLDMCPHRNVSNGIGHWTQAPPELYSSSFCFILFLFWKEIVNKLCTKWHGIWDFLVVEI